MSLRWLPGSAQWLPGKSSSPAWSIPIHTLAQIIDSAWDHGVPMVSSSEYLQVPTPHLGHSQHTGLFPRKVGSRGQDAKWRREVQAVLGRRHAFQVLHAQGWSPITSPCPVLSLLIPTLTVWMLGDGQSDHEQ